MWAWFTEDVKSYGPFDLVVADGDLTEGEGKKEHIDIIEPDVDMQAQMAAEVLRVIKTPKYILVRGTRYHTSGIHQYEDKVAELLGCPIFDTALVQVNGVRFNFRHAQGRSDIPYGQGTQLFKEAVRDMLQGIVACYESADVVVRAHVHYFLHVESSARRAVSLPCMKIPEEVFARDLKTLYYDIGYVIIEVKPDGEVIIRKRIMPLRIVRKREYLCLT